MGMDLSEHSHRPVVLSPSDPSWPKLAEEEARRIAAVLGANLIEVHHIGSTAIPGILAKPVIDLAPEVRDIRELDRLEKEIRESGYEYWGEYGLPGRRFCPRLHSNGERAVNVHCYQTGDPELHRHITFRDYLRAYPEVAREYERVKIRARDLHPDDLFAYNDEKDGWIRKTERDALAWKA